MMNQEDLDETVEILKQDFIDEIARQNIYDIESEYWMVILTIMQDMLFIGGIETNDEHDYCEKKLKEYAEEIKQYDRDLIITFARV